MSASRFGSSPDLVLRLLAALAIAAACAPLLRDGFVGGHEGPAYLFRAAEFAGQLAEGETRPRWCPNFYWGYGYPFFAFYPPGLFYLTALGGGLGLGIAGALETVTALGWIGFFFGVRRLARCWTGDRAAIVAGAAAVVATYRLSQVHVRGDLAEALGTALLPWVLAEFVLLTRAEAPQAGRPKTAAIGALLLGLMFYVHTLSAVAACMCVGLLGFYAWGVLPSVAGLRRTAWAAAAGGVGVLVGASYWLPVQVGRPWVRTEQMLDRVPGEFSWWYADHFVAWWQRLDPGIGFGDSVLGTADTMSFGSNPIVWVGVAAAVVLATRARDFRTRAAGPLLALLVGNLMLLSLSKPIWDVAPLLPWFQFPWRILLVEGLAAAVVLALVVDRYPERATLIAVLLLASAGPALWACWSNAQESPVRLMPDQVQALEEHRGLATVGMHHPLGIGYTVTTAARNEYLPKRVRQPPTAYPDAPGRIRRSNDLGPATDEFGAWRRWVVDLPAPGIYEVAWFAFPGLRATLNDEPLTILDDDEPRGLVRFELPAGHHVVNVWYSKPPGQAAGSGLAALGLLLVLGGLRYGRLKR
jgi:hypothetical protein